MKPQRTEQQSKAVWGGRVGLALVIAGAVLVSSCASEAVRQGEGSSYLVITSLQASRGDDDEFGNSLSSDVLTIVDKETGETSIFADNGQVEFALQMKDPNGLGPSPVNAITITQYHVEYIRSDGRNTPGVDVPHPFDGAVTATVSGTATVGFTLVRNQAKSEAPLQALRNGGGARIISTIARVTFYGRDQAGRGVSITGNISVDFADWGE
jgi:hypothetical protein